MAQQAMTAFDPLVRIGVQLGETASAAGLSGSKADEAVSRALRAVGLDPARILRAFPCELSGGMLQRVMTACVLILRPDVILADEPTSALDVVNVRAVLASLQEVRRTTGSALVLVTHDLGLAAGLADRFVILMSGGIVEKGGREIFERPSHPYTQRLALAWRQALRPQRRSRSVRRKLSPCSGSRASRSTMPLDPSCGGACTRCSAA